MANPPWEKADARVLVLRLSSLRDVAGSASHLVIFSEVRQALPAAYIDFTFFPTRRDRAVLSERRLPYFFGLESGRPPEDFDLILVSNAFALELVNVGYIFERSPIASRASGRAAEGAPIVILGGSNAAAAGALLLPGSGLEEESDCLVDGIFFGEGEHAIGELASILARRDRPRAERLAEAASVEGFWAARSGQAAARRSRAPSAAQPRRLPHAEHGLALAARLQISSGCQGYCSFCLEGWESRPYREFPAAELLEEARELKAASGASTLEVFSFSFNAHSEIFALVFGLSRLFTRVSLMSQRLDAPRALTHPSSGRARDREALIHPRDRGAFGPHEALLPQGPGR